MDSNSAIKPSANHDGQSSPCQDDDDSAKNHDQDLVEPSQTSSKPSSPSNIDEDRKKPDEGSTEPLESPSSESPSSSIHGDNTEESFDDSHGLVAGNHSELQPECSENSSALLTDDNTTSRAFSPENRTVNSSSGSSNNLVIDEDRTSRSLSPNTSTERSSSHTDKDSSEKKPQSNASLCHTVVNVEYGAASKSSEDLAGGVESSHSSEYNEALAGDRFSILEGGKIEADNPDESIERDSDFDSEYDVSYSGEDAEKLLERRNSTGAVEECLGNVSPDNDGNRIEQLQSPTEVTETSQTVTSNGEKEKSSKSLTSEVQDLYEVLGLEISTESSVDTSQSELPAKNDIPSNLQTPMMSPSVEGEGATDPSSVKPRILRCSGLIGNWKSQEAYEKELEYQKSRNPNSSIAKVTNNESQAMDVNNNGNADVHVNKQLIERRKQRSMICAQKVRKLESIKPKYASASKNLEEKENVAATDYLASLSFEVPVKFKKFKHKRIVFNAAKLVNKQYRLINSEGVVLRDLNRFQPRVYRLVNTGGSLFRHLNRTRNRVDQRTQDQNARKRKSKKSKKKKDKNRKNKSSDENNNAGNDQEIPGHNWFCANNPCVCATSARDVIEPNVLPDDPVAAEELQKY